MKELNLKIWKRGSQRAPHKPLLLLYALGKWKSGQREFPWLEINERVGGLIDEFGGNAKPDASNPFVRLRNDLNGKLWQIEGELVLGASDNPIISSLKKNNNIARFHSDFEKYIRNENAIDNIVNQLLVEHFSETQFEDILDACGLSGSESATVYLKRSKRNPEFRQAVLDAYGHKCAICDYDIQFRTKIIGVEAAHIQWHNSEGPDVINNGVALCAIHHKLLDYGAIAFNDGYELISATGLKGAKAQLDYLIYDHEYKQITLPRNGMSEPSIEYLRWQRKEIFKGQ